MLIARLISTQTALQTSLVILLANRVERTTSCYHAKAHFSQRQPESDHDSGYFMLQFTGARYHESYAVANDEEGFSFITSLV